jgi:outer membrane protein assembly factor BamB
MKKILIVLIGLLTFAMLIGTSVQAEIGVNYNTYTLSDGRLVRTQIAYVPVGDIDSLDGVSLDTPMDIDIVDNQLFIASITQTNGKIIVYDMDLKTATVIGEDFLVNPTGVFATEDGHIYVADQRGQVAYKLDMAGNILVTYTKPDSPLFGTENFQPKKIITDARGNVYILNIGVKGLAQFTNDGDFLAYYGTNTITPTLRTVLQYTFFTDEQIDSLFNLTPPEVSNMAIDDRGLIHTVSLGDGSTNVKRLNISGDNLLPEMFAAQNLVDVYVGPIGNIFTVSREGMVYEYDIEGNLLFAFGGNDITNQIQGLMNQPSSIAVDDDSNIYVLDRGAQVLKIYYPTVFADYVHEALMDYQEGFYVESQEPWREVLKMNDFFDLAHKGMANAYFSLGEYDEALEEYYIANDRAGYSDAYWEVRNAWLIEYAPIFVIMLFVLLVVFIINIKFKIVSYAMSPLKKGIRWSRSKSKTVDQILFVFSYLRNPADKTYEIKRKNRVQIFPVTVLLIIYFICYVFYIYNLGFLFNNRQIENINLIEEIIKIILPIIVWVIANFLIGSIREGEGRLKDVYITTIYSLAPYFLLLPIIAIVSQVLTYNESFIVSFMHTIAIMLTVIYFFFMVKETHFYNVKETFKSIFISAFTMVMMLLGVFILYILLNELVILIKDIIMEVFYRVADR